MKKNRRAVWSAAAVVTGVAVVGISTIGASAEASDSIVSQRGFYTEDQVDAAWAAMVNAFPAALPEGTRFAATAPAFFHPEKMDARETHVFQAGLIDSIAATYWRCSWLSAYVETAKSKDATGLNIAAAALEGYANIPGSNAGVEGFKQYQASLNEHAQKVGVLPEELEFANDCGLLTEGEVL